MPDIKNTTRAQTLFLRAFHTSPTGPDPALWPSPAILRKWLRKPAFRAALKSIQESLQFQTDFQLANAATQAATKLPSAQPTPSDLARILRLAHLRQRFTTSTSGAALPPADDESPEPEKPINQLPQKPNPYHFENEEAFKHAAWRAGFSAPLREMPDFPPPVPQDTFYYKLLQSPQTLLHYMDLYDRSGNDHRFQPILINCKILLGLHNKDYNALPKFQSPSASGRPNE